MLPSQSPFPCHWWGTDLHVAGLDDARPNVGTYGRYEFDKLPPIPFQLLGDFAWLEKTPKHDQSIGDEKAADNVATWTKLKSCSDSIGIALPSAFIRFMEESSLHQHIRSNTDCFLDLCPEFVRSPIGDGYLIRFLADSQGCIFWYLYITSDGTDHGVVSSPEFYGSDYEQWQDEPPDAGEIVYVAESFEAFICRFWLENEIWFSDWQDTPMPEVGIEYIKAYRGK